MGTAERLYELAKTLPEDQAAELLDFAEFLLRRSRQRSADVVSPEANKPLDFRQAAGPGARNLAGRGCRAVYSAGTGGMGLTLKKEDIVFLDTSPFIYFFERHPTFFPYVEMLFNQIHEQEAEIISSIVTFIEIATLPTRLGNQELVEQYRAYFTSSSRVRLFPVDQAIAEQAITLRGNYQLKTPDATQLGTAIACQANYIVTNDLQWKQLTNQMVLTVEELE